LHGRVVEYAFVVVPLEWQLNNRTCFLELGLHFHSLKNGMEGSQII
jgi:hypothetical protein